MNKKPSKELFQIAKSTAVRFAERRLMFELDEQPPASVIALRKAETIDQIQEAIADDPDWDEDQRIGLWMTISSALLGNYLTEE